MTEPQPLKDEIFNCPCNNSECHEKVFYEKKVAAAVEWLKQEIDKMADSGGDVFYGDIMDIIDEAFSDVVVKK